MIIDLNKLQDYKIDVDRPNIAVYELPTSINRYRLLKGVYDETDETTYWYLTNKIVSCSYSEVYVGETVWEENILHIKK